jgi:predicted O-methyltransferase YrrM
MLSPAFRLNYGWRSRPIFGALRLRRPAAQHTEAEGLMLRDLAGDARVVVEIGVAEGGSAWEAAQVMRRDATLHLIDPYLRRTMGRVVPARRVAKRLVASVARGRVEWHECCSHEAVVGWNDRIDLLFIDGDHSYEGVRQDFEDWTPHLAEHGRVALHDARLGPAWTSPDDGPVRLLAELAESSDWVMIHGVDSLAVLQRP